MVYITLFDQIVPKFDCSSYKNKKESDTVADFLWLVFIHNECTLMRCVLTITLHDLCYCVFICNPLKINYQDNIAAVLLHGSLVLSSSCDEGILVKVGAHIR